MLPDEKIKTLVLQKEHVINSELLSTSDYSHSILEASIYPPYEASIEYTDHQIEELENKIDRTIKIMQETQIRRQELDEINKSVDGLAVFAAGIIGVKIPIDLISVAVGTAASKGLLTFSASVALEKIPAMMTIASNMTTAEAPQGFQGEKVLMRYFMPGVSSVIDTIDNIYMFTILQKSYSELGISSKVILDELDYMEKIARDRYFELSRIKETIKRTKFTKDLFQRSVIEEQVSTDYDTASLMRFYPIVEAQLEAKRKEDLLIALYELSAGQQSAIEAIEKVSANVKKAISTAKKRARRLRILQGIQLGLQLVSATHQFSTSEQKAINSKLENLEADVENTKSTFAAEIDSIRKSLSPQWSIQRDFGIYDPHQGGFIYIWRQEIQNELIP